MTALHCVELKKYYYYEPIMLPGQNNNTSAALLPRATISLQYSIVDILNYF